MRLPSTRPTTPSWRQANGRIAAFLRQRSTQIEPAIRLGNNGQPLEPAARPIRLANQISAGNAHAHAVLFDQPAALDFGRDHHWRRHVAGDAGPGFVCRFLGPGAINDNNEIAGFKFATVGVLYAVLLAFVIIVVWEKFTDAEVNVVREAGAAENIYR